MIKHELHFLLSVEVVYGAGFEVAKGIVGWGEDGHSLGGAVELVSDLGVDLGGVEEHNEGGELAGFFKDSGEIDGAGGAGGGGRRGLG